MSNLSELLPAGSSVKSADFVAQGTLASGVTVGLRSDGKVEAITGQSGSVGTKVVFEAAVSTAMAGTYDSANNKVVFVYNDYGNSYYGTAIVGTVSGTAITFGSAVVFNSGSTALFDITFDSNVNKVVIGFQDGSNGNAGTGLVGTVSGTSISFGSEYVFISSCQYVAATFDSNSNKVVFGYRHHTTDYAMGIVGTVSGTAISYGSEATAHSVNSAFNALTFDSNSNKVVLTCRQATDGAGVAVVGTVSGTSISFGTAVTYVASLGSTTTYHLTFDSNSNKVVIGYSDSGNSNYGTAIVGTVSGTSISFGTPVVFDGANNALFVATVFDSVSNKIVISYRDDSVSNSGTVITGTVSGTSISFSGKQVYASSSTDIAAVFDVNANATVSAYYDGTNSNYGTASVTTTAFSNVSSYVGITDQAISSAATGKVVCKGGAITNTGLLSTFTPSFSTPVRYTTSNSVQPACSVCYDTTNDRYVMFYTDSTNSNYGYATVGTYSSGTTTWGTPVAVNSVNSSNVKAVFDASQGKVLFVYTNGSDSSKLVSAVGTVSGTSISVGSAVTMSASLTSTANTSVTYDANVNRSLVLTRVGSDSSKVYASVVSISGTTPTFNGTAVLTGTLATTKNIASCFDPDTNKVAAFVYDANASTTSGYVVTVSASSFSTSAGLNIGIGETLGMLSEYSTVANQVLVFVKPSAVSASQARTFTVAATLSVSSDWVNVTSSATASTLAIAEDVSKSVVVLAGQDEISGAQGKVSLATISGASLTVTTATVFQASAANPATAVYNPDSSNVLIGYRNGSSYGTSAIVSVTSDTLTIGSNYFVQDDGTISTTSSTTKAGTALSTTSLLLTG